MDLTNRVARCGCGKEAPSSPALPFFEYQGPGSHDAESSCRHCRYYKVAHEKKQRGEKVTSYICDNFENDPQGRQDTYYCGCRGWD